MQRRQTSRLRRAASDAPLLSGDGADAGRQPTVVTYSIEMPLHCLYDQLMGQLVVETPVVRAGAGVNGIMLRLQFSGEATRTFVTALHALEEIDVEISDIGDSFCVQ